MSYQDQTKDELQDQLRKRDLRVSGSKGELIRRLEQDDAASQDGRGGDRRRNGRGKPAERDEEGHVKESEEPGEGRIKARDAAGIAARHLAELGGRRVSGIAGFERVEEGWRVLVEVVEVARVPSSTDVLGQYAVTVDERGELLGYERLQRYVRAQAGGSDP